MLSRIREAGWKFEGKTVVKATGNRQPASGIGMKNEWNDRHPASGIRHRDEEWMERPASGIRHPALG